MLEALVQPIGWNVAHTSNSLPSAGTGAAEADITKDATRVKIENFNCMAEGDVWSVRCT